MTCLIKGCNFVLKNIPHEAFVYQKDSDPEFRFQTNHPNIFPYLLVNIGSGVSIVKVRPSLWKRAGLPQWHVEPWPCVRAVLGIGTWTHVGLAPVFMGHRQNAGHWLSVGRWHLYFRHEHLPSIPRLDLQESCHLGRGYPESPHLLAGGRGPAC